VTTNSEPRWDLIAHIQEQIGANTYLTEGKLRIACERLVKKVVVRPQPISKERPHKVRSGLELEED
jgi:hypothetical protein